MSIANLTSEQSKEYLDIKVKRVDTQEFNITNFTNGAIESFNTVPGIGIEAGGGNAVTNINFSRLHSKKINNIVFCNLYVRVDTNAGTNGTIFIARDQLAIAKTSDFTASDDVIGTGVYENSTQASYNSVYCNVGAGAPNRITFNFFKDAAIQNNDEIQINFSYTTD